MKLVSLYVYIILKGLSFFFEWTVMVKPNFKRMWVLKGRFLKHIQTSLKLDSLAGKKNYRF